jgi:hypothetical protein
VQRCLNGHEVEDDGFQFCPACGGVLAQAFGRSASTPSGSENHPRSTPLAAAPAPLATLSGHFPQLRSTAAAAPPRVAKNHALSATLAGLLLVVIGVFAPWVTTIGLINVSINGVASWSADGWAFLLGAGLALAALYRYHTRSSRRALIGIEVLGLIGIIGAVAEIVRIQRDLNSSNGGESFVHLSLGWGLYVLVLGTALVTAGSFLVQRADAI